MTLDEFEKLASGATPGRWAAGTYDGQIVVCVPDEDGAVDDAVPFIGDIRRIHDASFIAACRQAVPKLIAVARAVQAVTARYRAAMEHAGYEGLPNAMAELEPVLAALEVGDELPQS